MFCSCITAMKKNRFKIKFCSKSPNKILSENDAEIGLRTVKLLHCQHCNCNTEIVGLAPGDKPTTSVVVA
jgi:hypothetical protein